MFKKILLAIIASGAANHVNSNSERILEDRLEQLHKRGIRADGRLGIGDPVDVITSTARKINANLIVVGRRRSTINRWWRKSTSRNLLVVAPCSVLISRFLDGET